MAAAATVLAIFEDMPQEKDMPPRRPGSRPNIDETLALPREEPESGLSEAELAHWTPKQLSVRAINATLALAQQVGGLTRAVAELEKRLDTEYEDTKTHELRNLRKRDKWLKGIVTGVLTAVAIAEVIRWLGLPH